MTQCPSELSTTMTTVSNDIEAVQLQKEYLELYSAVGVGNAELVEALLTKGLDVNQDYAEILGTIGSNTSRFLLFEAVLHEQKEVVDTLLRHGSKVDIQDNDGVTPLMQAVYANALTILFLLLSHGANILAEDNMGRGALHLAASLNRPQIIEGIVHHKRHHLPSLVDHVSTTGETPLVVAVKAGHFASCDTLIQHGADPNKPDKIGRFPLHYAAELQNERLVKYLLRNLAFPFKYDQQGILPVAMTTNPSLISLFEDSSSYYTTDFRLYEEFASCSGISRLLHYQFVHLFHFYEAYRRNQESSTFTFDLAAATIAEDWDSVEKVVLGKAKDYVLINGDHRVRDRQKSVLSGSFFSYDAVEFYKQVDLVLNGINARLQYLAKDCLKGDHVLSELYACAEIRRKLQSFKVPPTTSFGPNESPKIGNTVGSSSSIINPIVPIASRKPIHQGRTEVGTSSDGLRDPKIQKAETPNFPSGVKLAESRNGRSMVNSNDDDHSDDEVAKNLLQLKAPSAANETPALAISLSLSKLEEKNRLDNISTATVASTPTIDPFDSEVEVSAVAYRKSSSRDTDVIDTNDSNSAPNQLTGKKRRRSQLPDQSDQQLVQEEISPTFREESKDKTQKKKGIKASNIPLALRSVDSKTSRRTRTT